MEFSWWMGWTGGPDGFPLMPGTLVGMAGGLDTAGLRVIMWPFQHNGLRAVSLLAWWLRALGKSTKGEEE